MKQADHRFFVIINPRSSNSDPDAIKKALARYLPRQRYEIFMLNGQPPLTEVIADAIDRGYTAVVAAGGDGTISGVAGAVAGTAVPMGVIPTGAGNGLARELNLPLAMDDAVALLADPPAIRRIDAIQIEEHYSVLRVGVGFETEVIEATDREEKTVIGGVAYFWTALRRAVHLDDHHLTITVDGQSYRWRHVRHLALVNGATLGAPGMGLKWGPHIRPDDGRINVCIIKHLSLPEYLRLFWRASQDNTQQDEAMHYLPAAETIEVTAERPLPVHCDGEPIGETPFRALVRPGAVSIFVSTPGGNQ